MFYLGDDAVWADASFDIYMKLAKSCIFLNKTGLPSFPLFSPLLSFCPLYPSFFPSQNSHIFPLILQTINQDNTTIVNRSNEHLLRPRKGTAFPAPPPNTHQPRQPRHHTPRRISQRPLRRPARLLHPRGNLRRCDALRSHRHAIDADCVPGIYSRLGHEGWG